MEGLRLSHKFLALGGGFRGQKCKEGGKGLLGEVDDVPPKIRVVEKQQLSLLILTQLTHLLFVFFPLFDHIAQLNCIILLIDGTHIAQLFVPDVDVDEFLQLFFFGFG